MDTFIIFIIGAAIVSFLYYQLQKRIGEDQSIEWKEFVKKNPHLFKKADTPIVKENKCQWPDEQKKSS